MVAWDILVTCLRIAAGSAVVFGSGLGDKHLTLGLRRSGDESKEKDGNQKKPECRDQKVDKEVADRW